MYDVLLPLFWIYSIIDSGDEMKKKNVSNGTLTVFEWLDSIVFALAFVLFIFTFILKTYSVQGTSMLPNFVSGDRVFAYGAFYTPQQGDVVIIDDNNLLREPLIKRVAAVGGQTIDIDRTSGVVRVDGAEFDYPIPASEANAGGDMLYPLTVPQGYVFVMGDNRAVSLDSRYTSLGLIDARSVVGKEFIKLG